MKSLFSNTKDLIFNIALSDTFKLVYGTNRIHEGATMRVLTHYAYETIDNALNSHMYRGENSALKTLSVRNKDTRSQNVLVFILNWSSICSRNFQQIKQSLNSTRPSIATSDHQTWPINNILTTLPLDFVSLLTYMTKECFMKFALKESMLLYVKVWDITGHRTHKQIWPT